MNRATIDLWVGIFVALGLAALLVLALKVGNLASANISDTYTVQANFANIGGLKVRAPVKSSGVVVGRVAGISFDAKEYHAVVSLQIDRRYEFPRDTIPSILTSGLLGEQYIGLEVGGDPKVLKDGDTFKITQSAVVLEKLISQFLFDKAAEGEPKKPAAAGAETK
ncbi:MAG: outer membrane lipid asymmetry maintenance protein MlaD [Rhodocyclaceae bacterium]|nr:outer membrane lipid asymmetry maintenance protein MlaD [Rhodocyclaceae bacterium]MBX3669328.1 outer membrane lipid asymmetry maintenance protein MlaD [Rhodocyclaceae bacterium]